MAQVNKIKINADEANLRDMMEKFNAFMTAYHNVGKGILQPDMFNDSMGESTDEQVDEAGQYVKPGSSTAYDRDYASSVSGMGKRDSIAYQQDGGANDEGWDDEPRSSYQGSAQAKTRMVGMFFYNVQPGQEQEAASLGVKKTKSGKWAKTKYNTSGRTFGFQKDLADKAFGVGKWWAPKTESVEQGVAEGSAHGYNVAKWYEKNGDQLKLSKWLRKEAGLPKDAKVYFDDADLVYGDQTIVPSALVNKSLKFNDLLTALVNATGGSAKQNVDGVYRTSNVAEMDKSQTPPGRDGSNSDSDAGKKEYTAKIAKPGDVAKKATAELDKEMKKSHAKESLSFKDYVNLEEAKRGLE
jgi:hypothetical protein